MTKRLADGQLEAKIMEVLWGEDMWLTPSAVLARVRRRPPLAYTTVMTVLVRLWDKGMLERRREGRAFGYRPVNGRDEWTAQRMHEMLEGAGDRTAALGYFVSEISRSEAKRLRELLGRQSS
jgi:predicted transcriptional regulator